MNNWRSVDSWFEEKTKRDEAEAARLEGMRRLMEEEWTPGGRWDEKSYTTAYARGEIASDDYSEESMP